MANRILGLDSPPDRLFVRTPARSVRASQATNKGDSVFEQVVFQTVLGINYQGSAIYTFKKLNEITFCLGKIFTENS